MIVFIIILSLCLESIMSTLIPLNSFFTPLLSIVSLVLIYPYFANKDDDYLKTCALVGLIYDLVFTDTMFFNMIVFLLIGLLIKLINIVLSNNFINVMLITLITIIIYLTVTYLILAIIGYKTFNFHTLTATISQTLLLNVLYSFLLYLITDKISKKRKILKID